MFTLEELTLSAERVHSVVRPTLQHNWPLLAERCGCDLWVKHENHTPTTAFKVRGGVNLVTRLMAEAQPPLGLISATRGNHGQSLAFAGRRAGLPVTIVVPECNSADQNQAIRANGAQLLIHGEDFEAARLHSIELQRQTGYRLVSPFEPDLVLGVATYALEFLTEVKDLQRIYVPIGMGSGICGLIKTRDLLGLKTEIVGVVAEGAPAFALSFQSGHIITTERADTLADGVATRAPMEEAFAIIKQGAADVVTVTDAQIIAAMDQYYRCTHNLAEGAGAAPLAAINQHRTQLKGKKVGAILSGGMIDFERFARYVGSLQAINLRGE